ncbi:MAG TPA: primosomal protein N' [Solirubrobacteraceae bacterium]|nr:primosomal protein N' [Solirubrobacteraceae bacterium]
MASIALVQPMTTARALRGPFDYRIPEELRERGVGVGSMLVVPFGRREMLGVVVGLSDRTDVAEDKLLAPLRALELGVPVELVALAEWVAREYCSTFARALALVLPPGAARRLSGRRRGARTSAEHVALGGTGPDAMELTAEQRAAIVPVLTALEAGRHERRLLHGVTGSGKTEIYLQAAAAALAQGRGAIVLVPEIALTPQIVTRFVERFGDTVAVLHSRLTAAQRYEQWRRLREGTARVCVGPRSAVFAPVSRLGLLVVDEEHDPAYKHEGDPRYDAREVAAERARAADAVLLLGSATPRPETVLRARTSVIARRPDGRSLPPVRVLDMREVSSGLHPETEHALAQVRAGGGKAIVLLHRRGWSNFLSCRSCGQVWSCPQCDVALVLHRAGGYVACHHCGHREVAPASCSVCASTAVARHGAGTERLAHDLTSLFDDGECPVFRLDADVVAGASGAPRAAGAAGAEPDASRAEGVARLLARFAAAERGVLVGTQMVAKGHDFPDVRLGVVLDADATLRFPDFRAEERTFALVAQLAGRVGRGGEGAVLVQTIAPQARAIAHASRHDSAGFLAAELERRRALSYPPFSQLVRIVHGADTVPAARAAALAVRERMLDALPGAGATLLGPAPLFRLRGRERQVLVLKAADRRLAAAVVGAAVHEVASGRAHAGVSFSVDVDPQ